MKPGFDVRTDERLFGGAVLLNMPVFFVMKHYDFDMSWAV